MNKLKYKLLYLCSLIIFVTILLVPWHYNDKVDKELILQNTLDSIVTERMRLNPECKNLSLQEWNTIKQEVVNELKNKIK